MAAPVATNGQMAELDDQQLLEQESRQEAAEAKIRIPELKLVNLDVTIKGTTPLITHRFGESARRQMEGAQQGEAKTKKPPRDPDAEFKESIYALGDGKAGFPSAGIKRAIVSAGQRFADEVGTQLLGSFAIPVEFVTINAEPPRMRCDLVRLSGPSRTASLAYRPEFWPWSITVPVMLNAGFLSAAQFINLLRLAGFGVGIGDWRVEKKGVFGQFDIDSVVQL